MDPFTAALNRPPRRDPRKRCGVGDWIRSRTDAEQDAIARLLADTDRKNSELAELFQENGMTLEMNAMRKHRVGLCACRR